MMFRVYDNAVDPGLLDKLIDEIDERGFQYGWKSNRGVEFGHWNLTFGGRRRKNRDAIEDEVSPAALAVWEVIQARWMKPAKKLIRCYVNAHTYGIDGYPHRDSKHSGDLTGVLYLNREWRREWGGETAIYDNEEIHGAVMPRWNRLVVFPSAVYHAARSLTRVCPEARLCFVVKARTDDAAA